MVVPRRAVRRRAHVVSVQTLRLLPTRLTVLLALAGVSAVCVAGSVIDPRFRSVVQVYHVNQRNYSGLRNMNSADLRGDLFFDLRSKALPLECGPWRNRSFWSGFECGDAEVTANNLAITKLELEIDNRTTEYWDCNVQNGVYSCRCDDGMSPGQPETCDAFEMWQRDCLNGTVLRTVHADQGGCCAACKAAGPACAGWNMPKGYDGGMCELMTAPLVSWDSGQKLSKCKAGVALPPGPLPPPCTNNTVGRQDLRDEYEQMVESHGDKRPPSPIDFWHQNTIVKTRGYWFDTMAEGECVPAGAAGEDTPGSCAWRILKVFKKIDKKCSDRIIHTAVQTRGKNCFSKCAQPTNSSTECWIRCFYDVTLGPHSATRGVTWNASATMGGIPIEELQQYWSTPFEKDAAHGGCDSIP